jgi:hypothetical protein
MTVVGSSEFWSCCYTNGLTKGTPDIYTGHNVIAVFIIRLKYISFSGRRYCNHHHLCVLINKSIISVFNFCAPSLSTITFHQYQFLEF